MSDQQGSVQHGSVGGGSVGVSHLTHLPQFRPSTANLSTKSLAATAAHPLPQQHDHDHDVDFALGALSAM